MSYLVLARRFRPRTFGELIGQESVTRTLRNAIASGKIHHAYLFCGPRGTGKTSAARILAKALNCEQGPTPDPCNQCDICARISTGDDYDVIEMDAASHTGVDYIRDLRENVQYATGRARYKIYIVDEVHMLTTAAFNALLKTLEEPPAHVKFIFATTEPQKILDTVHSRCQRYDFRRLGAGEIAEALAQICRHEEVETSEDALIAVARHARGGMRDALSLLDQLINYGDGTITAAQVRELTGGVDESALLAIFQSIDAGDAGASMEALCSVIDAGIDPAELTDALVERLREILLLATCGADSKLVALAEAERKAAAALAASMGIDKVLYCVELLSEARRRCTAATHPRIPLELAILRLARAGDLADLGDLAGKVSALVEKGGADLAEAARSGGSAGAASAARAPRLGSGAGKPRGSAAGDPAARRETAAPRAAPPSDAPESVGPLDLEQLSARWDAVRDRIRTENSAVAALLEQAVPCEVSGDRVTFRLPKTHVFQAELLSKQMRLRVIENALEQELGRRPAARFVTSEAAQTMPAQETLAAAEPSADPPQGASPPTQGHESGSPASRAGSQGTHDDLAKHPFVQDAVRKLQGRIVAIERGTPGPRENGG